MTDKEPNEISYQRVRNAEILAVVNGLETRLKRVETKLDVVIERTTRFDERWKQHDRAHGRLDVDMAGLRADIRKWSSAGGVAGAVASILVMLGIKQT